MNKCIAVLACCTLALTLAGCGGGLSDAEKNHLEAERNHMEQIKKEFENRPDIPKSQINLRPGDTAMFDDCDVLVESVEVGEERIKVEIAIKAYLKEVDFKLKGFQIGSDYPSGSSFGTEIIHIAPGEELSGTLYFPNNGLSNLLIHHHVRPTYFYF